MPSTGNAQYDISFNVNSLHHNLRFTLCTFYYLHEAAKNRETSRSILVFHNQRGTTSQLGPGGQYGFICLFFKPNLYVYTHCGKFCFVKNE